MDDTTVLDRLAILGDATRARILALLGRHELAVSELCSVLQMPQSTVSRHLKILSDDGWLRARSEGTRRHYRVASELPEAADELWTWLREQLRDDARMRLDRDRLETVLRSRAERSRAYFREAVDAWTDVREDLYGAGAELLPLFALLDDTIAVGDLGAGPGHFAAAVSPFVERVIAVDGSTEMVEAARARTAGLANVDVREGQLECLPIDDGALDVAVLSLVLHHVADPVPVLREARRALREDGRLVLIDMTDHEREEYRERMGHVWLGFAEADVHEILVDAGFARIHHRLLPPDPEASGPRLFAVTARA